VIFLLIIIIIINIKRIGAKAPFLHGLFIGGNMKRKSNFNKKKIIVNNFKLIEIIKGMKGIYSISFIKRDGSFSKLLTSNSMKKHKRRLKGVGKPYSDKERDIITLFGINRQRWTSVRLHSIVEIKGEGKVFIPLKGCERRYEV